MRLSVFSVGPYTARRGVHSVPVKDSAITRVRTRDTFRMAFFTCFIYVHVYFYKYSSTSLGILISILPEHADIT